MKFKIMSLGLSIILSASLLVGCGSDEVEEVKTENIEINDTQTEETTEEEKSYIIPPSGSEQDIKEKEAKAKETEEWHCPICGSTTCPKDSECDNPPKDSSYTCDICGKTGTCTPMTCYNYVPVCGICGKSGNLTEWTNSEGCLMITCDDCTEVMQLEDEVHRMRTYTCSNCGAKVQSNEVEWNGMCESCNNGWDPAWATKADEYYLEN